MMKDFNRALIAAVAAVATTAPTLADTAALAGLRVRVTTASLDGTHEGTVRRIEGCLYVQFDRATREGYSLVRFDNVRTLAVQDAGAWRARDARAIAASEPKKCTEAASD